MHVDVIIVGAGPAGLACARKLGQAGVATLVLERKSELGPKACAGGITWSGLLRLVPDSLIEATFPEQYIFSNFQKISVSEKYPLIATVNRQTLGQYMARMATKYGVIIRESCHVREIGSNYVLVHDLSTNSQEKISFDILVGADGSTSIVRRSLGIAIDKKGLGLNYQLPITCPRMEWHLVQRYFQNGYGWIFPHRDSTSVGAYIPGNRLTGTSLKRGLQTWAAQIGISLESAPCQAGLINYDFRGYHFDNIFLAGDAAGLASALTGEGIYPAIISGESIAEKILSPASTLENMEHLLKRQRLFTRAVAITEKCSPLSIFLAETGLLLLRSGIIDFRKLEMA